MLIPIIFFSVFFVVFIIIAIFSFKNARKNMKEAKTRLNQFFNSSIFGDGKNNNNTNSNVCEYCGSVLDESGKCPSCGAVKKIKDE